MEKHKGCDPSVVREVKKLYSIDCNLNIMKGLNRVFSLLFAHVNIEPLYLKFTSEISALIPPKQLHVISTKFFPGVIADPSFMSILLDLCNECLWVPFFLLSCAVWWLRY